MRLPTTGADGASGAPDPVASGGALLLDLKAVTEVLAHRPTATIEATEWWLSAAPGDAAKVAAALRALPDTDPAQVLVRAEAAQRLVDDPLGRGRSRRCLPWPWSPPRWRRSASRSAHRGPGANGPPSSACCGRSVRRAASWPA